MTKERKLKIGNFEIVCWKDFPCFRLTFTKCGYFDGRPEIKLGIIFWTFIIKLPFVNKEWDEECDAPEYGIAIHSNSFWVYYGGKGNMNGGTKWIAWDIPFVTRYHYKHEVWSKDGCWIDVTDHEVYKNRVRYLNYEDKDKPTDAEVYHGTWKDFDGEEVPAIYRLERRTWRRKWLMWTSVFDKQRTEIEVAFKSGVGKDKDSWKGGVYVRVSRLNQGELAYECFDRVNREVCESSLNINDMHYARRTYNKRCSVRRAQKKERRTQ